MDVNKFFQTKMFKNIISALILFIILLLVFKAGMIVGLKKADFSYRWSDNYHRNFGGPREGFLREFQDKNFLEANGTFGEIIKINGPALVIKGKNDVEKIIVVNDKTTIMRFRETIQLSDLNTGDAIVVIGEPNNLGQIEARLIRVMPPPPPGMSLKPMRIF